jgi:hypothetical protein
MKYFYSAIFLKSMFICTLTCVTLFTLSAHAQTSQVFIVSWKAHSFVPNGYAGKTLPTEKTVLDASFEILRNGAFMDLSDYDVTWTVDGRVVGQGKNKKITSFTPTAFRGQNIDVHIAAENSYGIMLSHDFSVLVSAPELIIRSLYFPPVTGKPREFKFQALPYFFNVTDIPQLAFSWQVNGSPATETGEKDILTVSLPSDPNTMGSVRIEAQAQNPQKAIEQASRVVTYTFQ